MSVLDSFALHGKTALVTGGAGLYGRQIVRALAEAGATTWVAARNLPALQELAQNLAAEGLAIHPRQFDQGDEASILALRDDLVQNGNGIDILVNNAVLRPIENYEDTGENFDLSMHVNATGLFLLTRAMGEVMIRQQRGGSIINIGSTKGIVGPEPANYLGTTMHGWHPDYFFHKGAIITYTKFLASYYGPHNIRCNCLSPGGFQTEDHPEEFVRRYNERTCLGRMANSTDLMGSIVYLASDASAYLTGTNIPIDGGYTAK